MGRYYKTAKPEFLDYSYKLPTELMMKASEKIDAQIGEQETSNEGLREYLKLQSIQSDSPAADKLLADFEGRIDVITQDIYDNPEEYRRKSHKITNLKRDISDSFTRGDASKIQGSYDARAKQMETQLKAYEKNPDLYDYEDIEKLRTRSDKTYEDRGGFETGVYAGNMLNPYESLATFIKDNAAGWKSDIDITTRAYEKDGYLYTSKTSHEEVKAEAVKNDIADKIKQNKPLMGYYAQQVELGNMTDAEVQEHLDTAAFDAGVKYGYIKDEGGRTSIRRDSGRTPTAQENANAKYFGGTNVTPGALPNIPLGKKYGGNDYSMEGLTTNILAINKGMASLEDETLKLFAGDGIIFSEMQTEDLKNGNYMALATVVNEAGEVTTPGLSHEEAVANQTSYDNYIFERDVFLAQEKIAENMSENDLGKYPTPQAYLDAMKKKQKALDADSETPGAIVIKAYFDKNHLVTDRKTYDIAVAATRKELHTNEAMVYHADLTIDVESLNTLPKDDPLYLHIVKDRKDGKFRPMDLRRLDIITMKTIGKDDAGVYAPPGITVSKKNQEDLDAANEAMGAGVGEAGRAPTVATTTSTSADFIIDGMNAKPVAQLGEDGQVMMQMQINYKGYPLLVYIGENDFKNETLVNAMDKPAMQAAAMGTALQNAGIITEKGHYVQGTGVRFLKVEGQDKAQIYENGILQTVPFSQGVNQIKKSILIKQANYLNK